MRRSWKSRRKNVENKKSNHIVAKRKRIKKKWAKKYPGCILRWIGGRLYALRYGNIITDQGSFDKLDFLEVVGAVTMPKSRSNRPATGKTWEIPSPKQLKTEFQAPDSSYSVTDRHRGSSSNLRGYPFWR